MWRSGKLQQQSIVINRVVYYTVEKLREKLPLPLQKKKKKSTKKIKGRKESIYHKNVKSVVCNWEKEKQGELYVFGTNDYF